MINTVFTYDKMIRNGKIVPDYTSYWFTNLKDYLENYDNYFTIVSIPENEKIENLAYKLFGSENYADLILAINDENFLWSSPYNQDVLNKMSDAVLLEFLNQLNLDSFNENLSYLDFKQKIEESIDNTNSQKKYFKVPKPENLSDVISLINNYKQQYHNPDYTL
jgi:ribosome-interacting GTPase 1